MPRASKSQSAITQQWRLLSIRATALLVTVLLCSNILSAYSVLTHEEIVDLVWTDEIQPLLLKRFPALSPDQLRTNETSRANERISAEKGRANHSAFHRLSCQTLPARRTQRN